MARLYKSHARLEISIDLSIKITAATKADMGADYSNDQADDVLYWLFKQDRFGRKSKAGFYEYDLYGKRTEIWQGLPVKYTKDGMDLNLIEVQHRLMFAQALKAVRALQDGVLVDVREADVGAILGWGFAPWSGGPLSWLDMLGASYAVTRCGELRAAYGPRFTAPNLLLELAEKGDAFYNS